MPPSGFNEKAIEGLLLFVEGCYEDLLKEMKRNDNPQKVIEKELTDIKRFLKNFTIEEN